MDKEDAVHTDNGAEVLVAIYNEDSFPKYTFKSL